jgi:hypothetical protein
MNSDLNSIKKIVYPENTEPVAINLINQVKEQKFFFSIEVFTQNFFPVAASTKPKRSSKPK